MQDHKAAARAAAKRVIELEDELEAGGNAVVEDAALETARAILHKWIDGLTAIVASPALGRVTVIHGNGKQSSIASPDLPFLMTAPLGKRVEGK